MEALRRANDTRSYRKHLKAELKVGQKSVSEVLEAPAPEVESMKVLALLLAMPKVGRVKAQKALRDAGVSPTRTIGGLSPRQRREILARMPRTRVHAASHSGRPGT